MSLQSKTVKQLKDMARGKVKGFSKMKKAELVAALGGGSKVVNLLPQQRGLKKGDKEKYLNAKKNIKKLNAVDIVKLGLPSGLENSLQNHLTISKKPKKKIIKKVVAPKPAAPKKPKKKIIKKVVAPKKEAPKQRPRRAGGRTRKEIAKEAKEDTRQDLSNANGELEIGKLNAFDEEDADESENRVALGFYTYRNIKTNYKDDKNLNKLADEFKKLVVKRKNSELMKEALKLNKISTSTGTRLKDTKKDVNKIYNELVKEAPKKELLKNST